MAVHTGHRARVREKILQNGTTGMLPHELLEAVLFPPIPRRDTNPIAHLLLERAGSLAGVFRLNEEDVAGIPGCGAHLAAYLAVVGEICRRGYDEPPVGDRFDSREAVFSLAVSRMRGVAEEATWLFLFDNLSRLISAARVFTGYYARAAFRSELVAGPALRAHASQALLVSTHPDRGARPDAYEMETSRYLSRALGAVGVRFIDHLIVSGAACLSVSDAWSAPDSSAVHYDRLCADTGEGDA